MRRMDPPDVLVLGGGLAGLAAAVDLAQKGARVTLLEKRAVLGGRASSTMDRKTGHSVDNGHHALMGCYRHTLDFLQKIGTRDKVIFQKSLALDFCEPGCSSLRLSCPKLPGPFHLLFGLFGYGALTIREKIQLLRAGIKLTNNKLPPDMTVSTWLALETQTPKSIKYFWEPLVLATLNAHLTSASVRLLAKVFEQGLAAGPRASALGFSTVGLTHLYADDAARVIMKNKGHIERSQAVYQIIIKQGIARGVRLSDGTILQAGVVISAIPYFSLYPILPPDLTRAGGYFNYLTQLRSSPILSIHLWLDRVITSLPWAALLGTEIQWVFNKAKLFLPGEGDYLSLTLSAADRYVKKNKEQLVKMALEDLRKLFPEARKARVKHSVAFMERNATLSADPKTRSLRPGVQTDISGFLLAGDWVDTGLPATMESAVLSGQKAADLILQQKS